MLMQDREFALLREAVTEPALRELMAGITAFHRIQGSPGLLAAVDHCKNVLEQGGLTAERLEYPASESASFWTAPSLEAWSCREAWLRLKDGTVLADFSENPISIIQRSAPFREDRPVEVVELDRGPAEQDYPDLDLQGKLVFVHEHYTLVRDWAVEQRGAIGYITDHVDAEPQFDGDPALDSVRQYTSFWWRPGQTRTFGYVLTPEQGRALSARCAEMRRAGRPLTVRCRMDSTLGPGTLHALTACLPGTGPEEVLVTAHLCHPMPSANDNASGDAAAMTALLALQRLISQGVLPRPERTIRLNLVPEILGSYAWLSAGGADRTCGLGLVLDMVGGKQDGGRGPLTLYESPHSTPGVANALAGICLRRAMADIPAMNACGRYSMQNHSVQEFIEGSDHGILNDPGTGIQAPLLCQWPDRFTHTDHDTLEGIDYSLLRRSALFAALYLYGAATLSAADFPALSGELLRRCGEDMSLLLESGSPKELYAHYEAYYAACAHRAPAQFPPEEREAVSRLIPGLLEGFRSLRTAMEDMAPDTSMPEIPERDLVPVKRLPTARLDYGFSWLQAEHGTTNALAEYEAMLERLDHDPGDLATLTSLYIDNRRSLGELIPLVLRDIRSVHSEDAELILAYVRALESYGLVTLERSDRKECYDDTAL